jgi:hypothetical protein
LLSPTPRVSDTSNDETNIDDIFGITGGHQEHAHTPSTARRVGHGTEFREEDCPGPYELAENDVSSSLSYDSDEYADEDEDEEEDAFEFDNEENRVRHSTSIDSFDALESYVGSSDGESIPEDSPIRNYDGYPPHMLYKYSSSSSSPPPEYRFPAPPVSRPRRHVPNLNPNSNTTNFHRPLPLRSYESEAHLYPTAGLQGTSSHNRAGSVEGSHSMSLLLTDLPTRSSSLYPPPPVATGPRPPLSLVDQTWRQINAQLLVTLYGSIDVPLDSNDVAFVDGVVRQLRRDIASPLGWWAECAIFFPAESETEEI